MKTNIDIETIMAMLHKKILRTAETVKTDYAAKSEYVYSCEVFIGNIKHSSRNAAPELITITNEAVFEIGADGKRLKQTDEFNLVNIYNCDLESEKYEHRCGTMSLINSSVDAPKYPSLNAELYDSYYENGCIIWRERYTAELNPNTDKEILDRANEANPGCIVYRGEDGKIRYEYRGACVYTEPYKIDSGCEKYFYSFAAIEE